VWGYLINCEYFNNLNENGDMAGTCIMAGIYTSPYPSPYPIEKVGDSPYPYPCPVNAGIPRQNGDGFICHLYFHGMQNKIKIIEEWRERKETKFGPPKCSKTPKSRAFFFFSASPLVSLYRTWTGLFGC